MDPSRFAPFVGSESTLSGMLMHRLPSPLRLIAAIAMGGLFLLVGGCAAPPAPTATSSLTPVPTDTATPPPTPTLPPTATVIRTPLPSVTPTDAAAAVPPTPIGNATIAPGVPPPFTIALPEGWREGYSILPVRDGLSRSGVPVAIYTGPIPDQPDTTGWIVVLWGYPSLSATGRADPWADGLRFLRGALLDTSCTVGTDLSRYFSVGGSEDAIGTYFQAVGCQGEPDTAGWFAGTQNQGGNYVFYAYVDPLESFNPAIPTLQRILDSIVWQPIPTLTPSP